MVSKNRSSCAGFGSMCTEIGLFPRLARPLCKHDMQIHEALHTFSRGHLSIWMVVLDDSGRCLRKGWLFLWVNFVTAATIISRLRNYWNDMDRIRTGVKVRLTSPLAFCVTFYMSFKPLRNFSFLKLILEQQKVAHSWLYWAKYNELKILSIGSAPSSPTRTLW